MTNEQLAGMLQELQTTVNAIVPSYHNEDDGAELHRQRLAVVTATHEMAADILQVMSQTDLTYAEKCMLVYVYVQREGMAQSFIRQRFAEADLKMHRKTVKDSCWSLRDKGWLEPGPGPFTWKLKSK